MKVTDDPEDNLLCILFSAAPNDESGEDKPGMILDHDTYGNVAEMEILDASKRVENP